ncbi:MAG TPA: hypothetical protein P5277_02515 [Candidatus Paceibacterota bacterium]|nr:hypothetical protein [Candidatus Paceibacterota bacterium]
MATTHIRVTENQKQFLEKNRKYPRETYSDILKRVCKKDKSKPKICNKLEN